MSDKTRMAVVGCGMLAQGLHLPNVVKHPELELLWCCDVDENTLSTANAKFSPEHITTDARDVAADPDCDAVILATTQTIRLPLIDLFARAGKHIFVEKPIADNFQEMKQILSVVKDTGIKFQVGHNRRISPAVREARRVLNKHKSNPVSPAWRWDREGEDRPPLPGENQTMVLLRINDDFWSWKKWAFAHGALINEMTHFADLACCFIDSKPVRVTTTGQKLSNHVVTMEFEDGSIATIFATAFGSFGYPKELVEVYHNGAVIVLEHLLEMKVTGVVDEPFSTTFPLMSDWRPDIPAKGIEGYYRRIAAAQEEAVSKGDNSIFAGSPDKGHYALLDNFIQCIRNGETPVCSAETAAVPTAIVLRALESEAKGGLPVEIFESDYTVG